MAERGSRPGERRGGRKKGTPNKATGKRREVALHALERGISPLEYMLKIMRNPKANQVRRDEMARAAAPYVHPRLAAVVARVNDPGNPWEELLNLADGKSRGLPHQRKP